MTCIHGLDDINCPICRMDRNSEPKSGLKPSSPELKATSPQLLKDSKKKYQLHSNLNPLKVKPNIKLINPPSNPLLLNQLPSFKNKLFQERLDALDLGKLDKFGISKKTTLENPEYKLE